MGAEKEQGEGMEEELTEVKGRASGRGTLAPGHEGEVNTVLSPQVYKSTRGI